MAAYNGGGPLAFKRSRSDAPQDNDSEYLILEDGRRKRPEFPPNHVLLYTIINARYPITTEVVNTISSPYGKVNRIVIFRKRAVQAMVEFDCVETAKRAKDALDGADIYSGCCTLRIEYAKPTKLNVHKNDMDTWDFTTDSKCMRPALLPEPSVRGGLSGFAPDFDEFPNANISNFQHPHAQLPSSHLALRNDRPSLDSRNSVLNTGPSTATSPVLMVYDLDAEKANCDRLFNLLCLYGNVIRIKFLKTKPGCAMVQMGDNHAVDRCIANLNPTHMLNDRVLTVGYSKQLFVSDTNAQYELPDGTNGFKDYSESRNNRFMTPATVMKNRIHQPTKILHFYNTPTTIDEGKLADIFNNALDGITIVINLKIFETTAESRSSSGLVEFNTVEEATEALLTCNHFPIKVSESKFPFIMKLCFSSAKSINGGSSMKEDQN